MLRLSVGHVCHQASVVDESALHDLWPSGPENAGLCADSGARVAPLETRSRAGGEYRGPASSHSHRSSRTRNAVSDNLDEDGYPTDEALARLRNWKIRDWSEIADWLAFARSLWRYPDYWSDADANGEMKVATGGWSGNESVIDAMQENRICWSWSWVESRTGGGYVMKHHDITNQNQ